MQARLNLKLVVWTLLSVAVVASVVHVVHSRQVHANASALLRQADRAMAEKDFAQAAQLLHTYLELEPDDTDALVRYAAALEQASSSYQARFQAFLLLEQVVRREPDRHEIRRKAVQAAIDVGRLPEAVRHLHYLLAAQGGQAELYHRLGWCQEALGQYDASTESFRRAVRLAPNHIDSWVLLAELSQRRLGQADEAAKVMEQMVTANPRGWQAFMARARFHYRGGNLSAAAADTHRACELAPKEAEPVVAAAEVALLQGNLTEARTYVHRALQLQPKNETLYRSMALLESRSNHPAEAAGLLRRGLQNLPGSVRLRVQLVEVLVEQNQLQEAGTALRWLLDHQSPPGVVEYLQGRLLLASHQWADALEKLSAARVKLGRTSPWASSTHAALGRCYEMTGEPDSQLVAYREAVLLDTGDVAARLELARALLACRMPEQAVAELRALAQAPSSPPQLWVLLGQGLVQQLRRQPTGPATPADLEGALNRAAELTPTAPELAVLRAELLLLRGDGEGASALLQQAVAEHATEPQLWTALAAMQARSGKADEAAATLDKARRQLGPRVEVFQAALRFWLARPGPQAQTAVVELRPQVAALAPEDQIRLYREVADALLFLGERAEAEKALRQLGQLLPKDLRSRAALFDLFLADKREPQMSETLAELRQIEGEDGVVWRAGEAARSIQRARGGDLAQLAVARQRLEEIRQRRRDWSRAALLEGYVEELDGRDEQAMESYRRAFDLGERPPAVVLRVAQWLRDRYRYVEADRVIRQLQEVSPLPRELQRIGAEVALLNHDPKRAAALAVAAVPADTRDYREQLWLAHMQWATGRPLDAEATLRQAVKGAPRVPDVWVALVRHSARMEQLFQLDAAFEEMRQKMPDDRLATTLAGCYHAAGHLEAAEEVYRKALAQTPNDPVLLRAAADFLCGTGQFAKAEPYLLKLSQSGSDAPAELQVWARRQLALGLAQGGTAGGFERALALLESNRKLAGQSIEDERLRAFVLSTRPERRGEAVRLFEKTLAKKALSAEEQFLLAQLYESNRQVTKAREAMVPLVLLHGDNGQFLAFHVRSLVARGEVEEAQHHLAALERMEPNSSRTHQLRAALAKAKSGSK